MIRRGKKKLIGLIAAAVVTSAVASLQQQLPSLQSIVDDMGASFRSKTAAMQTANYTITFPSSKYPETAKHIRDAVRKGHPDVCTIDRKGAKENREQSLGRVPVKDHYDRDEWPMAMCAEGGRGADVAYITPSDNRGAGSWIGNKLDKLPDGTRVKIVVK